MKFADIHIHLLFGVDDGAKDEDEMRAIVNAAYSSGTRLLCCTPHFHPGYFGENNEKISVAFSNLSSYINEKYSDMLVFLGNEIRYGPECVTWLKHGFCRTLNKTRYVLVDFSETAPEKIIRNGLNVLLNAGYIPILAHTERYRSLHGEIRTINEFWHNGVIIQADTQSLFCEFGLPVQRQCRKLLSHGLVDIFSSDAHNCLSRPPDMIGCYNYVKKKHGANYAIALCYNNASCILHGETVRRNIF